jgi:peptidoglycan hydrolase-like protein with peptidoglycan-binding domain
MGDSNQGTRHSRPHFTRNVGRRRYWRSTSRVCHRYLLGFKPAFGMDRMTRGIIVVATLMWGLATIGDLRAAEERPLGFDCGRDRSALAVTVCNDRPAAAAAQRTTTSYLALYFGLGEENRSGLRNDHMQWLNGLTARCGPPSLRQMGGEQPAVSVECVRRLFAQRNELYRKKLNGAALEEANLTGVTLKKLQKRLVELKFLSGTADGMFGADTRTAIKNYQTSIGHAPSNFLTAQERNMLLGPNPLPVQASASRQPSLTGSESPPLPDAAPPSRSILQNAPSADNRQAEAEATDRSPEQVAQQPTPEASNPPAEAAAPAVTPTQADAANELQTQYFIEGTLLAGAILVFAAAFVFIRLRRGGKQAAQVVGAESAPSASLNTESLHDNPSTAGGSPLASTFSQGRIPTSDRARSVGNEADRAAAAVRGEHVHVEAPLAPDRLELVPHLEKGAKT